MQLLLSAPWWSIVFCLLAGLGYAFLLYQSHLKSTLYKILFVLRFLVVSILCFLLLSPLFVYKKKTLEKPKIILVLDQSESVINNASKLDYESRFTNEWKDLKDQLGADFDVDYLALGSEITPSDSFQFNQKKTHISQLFDYVNNTYTRQNIGAVVLASDGLFNRGINPLYKSFNTATHLYTIGLGDTVLKKDLKIKEANANAIAYLNNLFPVEIAIQANGCEGKNTVLTVSSNGKTLHTETVSINQPNFYKTVSVNVAADQPGVKHLIVTVQAVENEFTVKNNRQDVFVDVIDGREKIALVYDGPHPDIGAIKEAVKTQENYELISTDLGSFNPKDLPQYSVLILHQVPSKSSPSQGLMNAIKQAKIPVWCIVGTQTNVDQLNQLSPFAKIAKHQNRFNESQVTANTNFQLFTLETNTFESLGKFPPLKSPYGFYETADPSYTLAYQKIGSVNTVIPMLTFYSSNGEKTAFLYGEGLWKWRLSDYEENENHNASNEIINKTIQFLTNKEDKRKFKAYPTQNKYDEDEPVKFYAELYNANYEAIVNKNVQLTIKNNANKSFQYNFTPVQKKYQADLGFLNSGLYNYTAKAEGITETVSGKIIVNALQLESLETQANFQLLRDLSQKHNGHFFKNNELSELVKTIKNNTNITGKTRIEKTVEDLIHSKWIFALILILLTIEWFIRKYEGAY